MVPAQPVEMMMQTHSSDDKDQHHTNHLHQRHPKLALRVNTTLNISNIAHFTSMIEHMSVVITHITSVVEGIPRLLASVVAPTCFPSIPPCWHRSTPTLGRTIAQVHSFKLLLGPLVLDAWLPQARGVQNAPSSNTFMTCSIQVCAHKHSNKTRYNSEKRIANGEWSHTSLLQRTELSMKAYALMNFLHYISVDDVVVIFLYLGKGALIPFNLRSAFTWSLSTVFLYLYLHACSLHLWIVGHCPQLST